VEENGTRGKGTRKEKIMGGEIWPKYITCTYRYMERERECVCAKTASWNLLKIVFIKGKEKGGGLWKSNRGVMWIQPKCVICRYGNNHNYTVHLLSKHFNVYSKAMCWVTAEAAHVYCISWLHQGAMSSDWLYIQICVSTRYGVHTNGVMKSFEGVIPKTYPHHYMMRDYIWGNTYTNLLCV
jgi:hypothetical protein